MGRRADSGRPSFPAGAVGFLALAVLIEGVFAANADALSEWLPFSWRDAVRSCRRSAPGADVLCLGDSLVKNGVLPAYLEAGSGRPAFNLAVHSGSAPSSYYLLRRALAAGATPGAVVVDFHPNLLAAAPRSNGLAWAEALDWLELVELGWHSKDVSLVVKNGLARVLPSTRLRTGIRESVLASFRGEAWAERLICRAIERNCRLNRGGWASAVTPSLQDPAFLCSEPPGNRVWKPHRANVAYMRKLFAFAESRGVAVFWIFPPTSPAWQARRVALGADEAYARLARSMQAEFRNLVVVDGRSSGYGASAFRDLTHLHARGAAEFSAALGDVIGASLARRPQERPRWVALPEFRNRPADPALEDLEQSKTAIRRADGTVRL